MGMLLTLTASLALWVILWGTSIMKSFDAFLVSMSLVVIAASIVVVRPYLPGGKD